MRLVIALAIMVFSGVVYGGSTETYIPEKAKKYLPVLLEEIDRLFPDHPYKAYFPALIEQESCIHLKHKRCWDPSSELKTSREQGVGLGQLTRTLRKNGSLRFDKLQELRRAHKEELHELTWSNIKKRPDLQIRAIILLYRDNWKRIPGQVKDIISKMAMTDLSYNAGLGRVYKNRRVCGLAADCDPNIYFDNVERYCTASKRKLYGNRSACDIMKDHVEKTLLRRNFKYHKFLKDQSL